MSSSHAEDQQSEVVVKLAEPLPDDIDPEGFERFVKSQVESWGKGLEGFEVHHLESIDGFDGSYKIDVTARFRALGQLRFLCLFECKLHKRPVERADAQQLLAKMHSIGAQKGVLVSRSGFQNGALEYCRTHGIAAVKVLRDYAEYIISVHVAYTAPAVITIMSMLR